MQTLELRRFGANEINAAEEWLTDYIEAALNTALGSSTNGESTYTNAFSVTVKLLPEKKGYCLIGLNYPLGFIVDGRLTAEIQKILSVACYPLLTIFPAHGPTIVDTGSKELRQARGLLFPFKIGVYQRLHYKELRDVRATKRNGEIVFPLMRGYEYYPFHNSGHIAITGVSGNGKTAFGIVLLQLFRSIGAKITVVDPKLDVTMYEYCERNHLELVTPAVTTSDTGFLNDVIKVLRAAVDLIHQRQRQLLSNRKVRLPPQVVVIDEALALVVGAKKALTDQYLSLLNQLTMMGRSARVYLVILSQTLEARTTISSSARDQMGLKVLLSNNPTEYECRYLFKGYDPGSLVLNRDGFNKGLGIIQQQSDGLIVPFTSPLIDELAKEEQQ